MCFLTLNCPISSGHSNGSLGLTHCCGRWCCRAHAGAGSVLIACSMSAWAYEQPMFFRELFRDVELSDQLGLQGSLGRGDVFWSLCKMTVRTLLRAPSRSLPEGFRLHHSQLFKPTKLQAASYQAWSIIKHRILTVFARIARA